VFRLCFINSLEDVDQFFPSTALIKMNLGVPLLCCFTSFVFMNDES